MLGRSASEAWEGQGESLAREALQLLVERGLTLAVAESCTGGLLGHLITQVPGSSAAFLGGMIAYHNRLKEQLGVPPEVLQEKGAVSAETAREMAQGALRQTGADIALAVTGIAGPTGGTPEKPVGLTYIALAAPDSLLCERHVWKGDRRQNKSASARAALELLLRHLRGEG